MPTWACCCPSNSQTSWPQSLTTIRGARSWRCAGSRPSNMPGGSTRWSSTEMIVAKTSRGSGSGRNSSGSSIALVLAAEPRRSLGQVRHLPWLEQEAHRRRLAAGRDELALLGPDAERPVAEAAVGELPVELDQHPPRVGHAALEPHAVVEAGASAHLPGGAGDGHGHHVGD